MKRTPARAIARLIVRRYRPLVVAGCVAALALIAVKVIGAINIEASGLRGSVGCGSLDLPSNEPGCLVAMSKYELLQVGARLAALAALLTFLGCVILVLRRPDPHISGANVSLRHIGFRDARAVIATIDERVRSENRLPPNFDTVLRRSIRWTGIDTHLAICAGGSDNVVGIVSAVLDPFHRSRAGIGIWIAADHRGRRYATEAVAILVDHLHARGFEQVGAETAADNAAMLTVLARTGFVAEGYRQRFFSAHDIVDAVSVRHTRGEDAASDVDIDPATADPMTADR